MSALRRRFGALLAVSALAAALAGCGGTSDKDRSTSLDGLSGAEVIARAVDATADARTLRLRFTADTDRAHVLTDLHRAADGTCFGRMEFHTRTVTVIMTGAYTYVRASASYWRQFDVPEFGQRMARTPSTWARVKTADLYRRFCDVRELAADNMLLLDRLEDMQVGAERDGPDGRTVVDVTNAEGDPAVVIDADAPHHVLEMRFSTSESVSRTVLSEFDEPAEVQVPPEGEYIPFDRLVVSL